MAPEAVVARQLEAYNRHDLDGFLACYAEGVRLFRLPSVEPWLEGRAQVAAFYGDHRFNVANLRAEILNRMVLGNLVVDHERVHGLGPEPTEVVAVYEVANGLIERVWFHRPS